MEDVRMGHSKTHGEHLVLKYLKISRNYQKKKMFNKNHIIYFLSISETLRSNIERSLRTETYTYIIHVSFIIY